MISIRLAEALSLRRFADGIRWIALSENPFQVIAGNAQ
jgi:hypothetical protein